MNKQAVRRALKELRCSLGDARRTSASQALVKTLLPLIEGYPHILSFASFGSEIDLWPINHILAGEGRLLLPRVAGKDLEIYKVRQISSQLKMSPFGIFEPIPAACSRIECEEISVILVAGLGFDTQKHRIGYGRGYYDRLIEKCPLSFSIGLGFSEQLVEGCLPSEPSDRPVDALCLA